MGEDLTMELTVSDVNRLIEEIEVIRKGLDQNDLTTGMQASIETGMEREKE